MNIEDLKDLYVVSIKVKTSNSSVSMGGSGMAVLSKIKNLNFVTTLNYIKKMEKAKTNSFENFYFHDSIKKPEDFFSKNLEKIKAFNFFNYDPEAVEWNKRHMVDQESLRENLNSNSYWTTECDNNIKYTERTDKRPDEFKYVLYNFKEIEIEENFIFKTEESDANSYFFKIIKISRSNLVSHNFLNFGNYNPLYIDPYDRIRNNYKIQIVKPNYVSPHERLLKDSSDGKRKVPFNMLRDNSFQSGKSHIVELIIESFPEGENEKSSLLDVEDKKLLEILWVLENLNNEFNNETISKFDAYKEKIDVSDNLFDNMKDLDELSSFLFDKTKLENITTKKQCEFCLSLTSKENPICQFCFYDVNLNDFDLMENTIDVSEDKLRKLLLKIDAYRVLSTKIAESKKEIDGFERCVIYNYNKELKKWWVFKKPSLEDVRKKTSYGSLGYDHEIIDKLKLGLEKLKKELANTEISEGDKLMYNLTGFLEN